MSSWCPVYTTDRKFFRSSTASLACVGASTRWRRRRAQSNSLRIGEAATLEIGIIDGDNGLLRIIGKGNKERLVPLPEPMLSSLRRLWKTHKNPRWLFPTRAATNPVGRGTLNRTFAAAAQAAGSDRVMNLVKSNQPLSLHGVSPCDRLLRWNREKRR